MVKSGRVKVAGVFLPLKFHQKLIFCKIHDYYMVHLPESGIQTSLDQTTHSIPSYRWFQIYSELTNSKLSERSSFDPILLTSDVFDRTRTFSWIQIRKNSKKKYNKVWKGETYIHWPGYALNNI